MNKIIEIEYLESASFSSYEHVVASDANLLIFTRDLQYILSNDLKTLARLEGNDKIVYVNPHLIRQIRIQNSK